MKASGLAVLVFFTAVAVLAAAERQQPNVVFILADDLGWSDTTLYGTTTFYQTPNIQRLAKRGTVFTRAPARRAVMWRPGSSRTSRNRFPANTLRTEWRAKPWLGWNGTRIGLSF